MHSKLVVLGGGPGGYAAAFLAADEGLEVTLVEAEPRLGGTCLLRGCIPSKALLHVARVIAEASELKRDWGVDFGAPQVDLAKLRGRKDKLVETLAGGLKQLAKRRNVRIIQARGIFENSTTLRLEGQHESIPAEQALTFDHCVVAVGSTPIIPPPLRSESSRVMDSTGALALEDVPGALLVVGGGYIGLELATVYAQLGSKVSIVERTDTLLPGCDRDLVVPLQRSLKKLCEDRIALSANVVSLLERDGRIEATIERDGRVETQVFDRVLVAAGRRPNGGAVGLDKTLAQLDSRGFITCDVSGRTADPHLWAIGDVAGEPMLAHKATHDAKLAVQAILGRPAAAKPTAIPAVVFTDPEIAWAGLTKAQAEREGRQVDESSYPWAASGRAHAIGRTDGFTRWLIEPSTGRVLGCGIVGVGAGELIAEAALAIESGLTIQDVTHAVHPHPTLSETVANAGELYLGTAVDFYKPKKV